MRMSIYTPKIESGGMPRLQVNMAMPGSVPLVASESQENIEDYFLSEKKNSI